MRVRIEGSDLPGLTCEEHTNVHVGVQRKREVVELVAGNATGATWELPIDLKVGTDGDLDFRGEYVQGKRGDRFLYLSWGEVGPSGEFAMFRRAKLMLAAVPRDVLRAAGNSGLLVGRLGLTDGCGMPRCAATRPPTIAWSAA